MTTAPPPPLWGNSSPWPAEVCAGAGRPARVDRFPLAPLPGGKLGPPIGRGLSCDLGLLQAAFLLRNLASDLLGLQGVSPHSAGGPGPVTWLPETAPLGSEAVHSLWLRLDIYHFCCPPEPEARPPENVSLWSSLVLLQSFCCLIPSPPFCWFCLVPWLEAFLQRRPHSELGLTKPQAVPSSEGHCSYVGHPSTLGCELPRTGTLPVFFMLFPVPGTQ